MRLLVMAAIAAVAAGCGTAPERAPMPPLGVAVGTPGSPWPAIGAGMSGRLDPASDNACSAGSAACMPAVVREMSLRLQPLAARCDHRAPFLLMYRQVSREVRDSVRRRAYAEPAYVAHLDAVFATLYFHAADAWERGDRDAVPRSWRLAFAAAQRRELSALGDMMLGMNAHISRDLPFALAAVGLTLPGGRDAGGDVTAINADIGRAQDPMLRAIAARLDPQIGAIEQLGRRIDPRMVATVIAEWRAEAARDARALLAAPDAIERRRVERAIDAKAYVRSLAIWRAARVPRAAARERARYCSSRRTA